MAMPKGTLCINVRDIVGNRYGRVVVAQYEGCTVDYVASAEGCPRRVRHWYTVRCDCGNDHRATRDNIVHGHIKSCGCMQHK